MQAMNDSVSFDYSITPGGRTRFSGYHWVLHLPKESEHSIGLCYSGYCFTMAKALRKIRNSAKRYLREERTIHGCINL